MQLKLISVSRQHQAGARPSTVDAGLPVDRLDIEIVSGMRVILSLCVFLAFSTEHDTWRRLALVAYVLYSAVLWKQSRQDSAFANGRWPHWLDVLWPTLIVESTGNGILFLLFLFATITASFRHGVQEGSRIALVSAMAFLLSGIVGNGIEASPQLLLRTAFLLALGYMCAHWGQANIDARRRLALLRDIANLANPRFGTDHVFASIMEKIRSFYAARQCIVVMEPGDGDAGHEVRVAGDSIEAQPSAAVAAPLLALLAERRVLFAESRLPSLGGLEPVFDASVHDDDARRAAALLSAHHYISVPFIYRRRRARAYVVADGGRFRHGDLVFLADLAAQACRSIESVAIVEQMACDAALDERKRLAWDLHDSVIQTYLGLNFALGAIVRKALPVNPLFDDLVNLSTMTTQVIADLRQYAGALKERSADGMVTLYDALREKASHLGRFYGIDIAIDAPRDLQLDERLACDILQIVHEGLSNICRHTTAQHGSVRVRRHDQRIELCIENEAAGAMPPPFHPRSIARRVARLGGRMRIVRVANGPTGIHINIPL
jgi:signal transduction histidine kinase